MLKTSQAGRGFRHFPSALYALPISFLVVVGSYSILPVWLAMWVVWVHDPLRAIGAVFPAVAFAGTLAAWRRIGWSMNGSFWGLPLLAASILLARFTMLLIVILRVHEHNEGVLHPGVVMFLYGIAAVLLFGGPRLLRAAIAPLCLLLCVDPVPHSFNALVDLPLQFLSANTARHFAHLIGLRPTGEQLRMMFTPDFGMMIVPGCNGVRGSVTLGYLALIFGYIRHLRPRALTLTTLGAFLMGYLLNLLRLCTLVVYYRIGISHPSIQPYGASVDYGIGCTLFLFATLGVGLFIRWIEPKAQTTASNVKAGRSMPSGLNPWRSVALRAACFLIVTLAFIVPTLGKGNSIRATLPSEEEVVASFPSQVGRYRLVRTYEERDSTGLTHYVLADYSTRPDSTDPGNQLTFGVYVGLGMHLVASSRFALGIRPDWIGSFDTFDGSAQQHLAVHYVSTLFDDGISRQFNAESGCYETGCSANIESGPKSLLVIVPKYSDLIFDSNSNRLPILLRREWPDRDATPTAVLRSQFEADARQFTSQLNLRALLRADGTPI